MPLGLAELLKIKQELGFYGAGGGQRSTGEQIGGALGSIGQGLTSAGQGIGQGFDIYKKALENRQLQEDMAPVGEMWGLPTPQVREALRVALNNRQSTMVPENIFPQPTAEQQGSATEQIGPANPFLQKAQPAPAEQLPQPQELEEFERVQKANPNINLDMSWDQNKTNAEIDALNAKANKIPEEDQDLFINPTSREISTVPKQGYYKVSRNTAATIAAGPAKETAVADRQEENQKRAAEIREASENRAKYKAEFDTIETMKNSVKSSKDTLGKVPTGIQGGLQSLVSKTGYGFEDAAGFDADRNALAVMVYRTTTGDTRLSDADAATRALPLIPKTRMDEGQRNKLWQNIEDKIEFREQQLQKGIKEVPWKLPQEQPSTKTNKMADTDKNAGGQPAPDKLQTIQSPLYKGKVVTFDDGEKWTWDGSKAVKVK